MRLYLILAVALATLGALWASYNAGKKSVVSKLQTDRIEVLQDGKKIDANVFAADDDNLICLLIDCKDK